MYAVSQAYLNAIKQPAQKHYLYGSITTPRGYTSFDKDNVVSGSFHIQNQCSPNTDLVLGSVYTGTLTATFHDVNVPRNSWIGQVITPQSGIELPNGTTERIPLGIFTVAEATHTAEGVEVVAYDNMTKFDKKFKAKKFKTPQPMYDYLYDICIACGVTLGMTQEQVENLPNGSTDIGLTGCNGSLKDYGNDLNTYRDLLYWAAQTCVCFATIDRQGRLVLRRFKKESAVVDEISESYRLAGARFEDYTTNYVAIYVNDTTTGEDVYYGYDAAALRQQLSETAAEVQDAEDAIDELEEEYQQGQITEEEYREGVALCRRHIKALNKRLAWLEKALEKAIAGDDGVFMDLGENPMLQPDGVGATNTAMRTKILEKVSDISYTPFTCSTVFGVHYDLGDIIRFVGGHATDDGEVCCIMSYDYNFNGEYVMEGYGADPNGANVKPLSEKSVNSAKKSENKVNVSSEEPDSGKNGDLWITPIAQPVPRDVGLTFYTEAVLDVDEVTSKNNVYDIKLSGTRRNVEINEYVIFSLNNFQTGEPCTFKFTIQIPDHTFYDATYPLTVSFSDTADPVKGFKEDQTPGTWIWYDDQQVGVQSLYRDNNEHTYTCSFTATSSTMYLIIRTGGINLNPLPTYFTFEIKDFSYSLEPDHTNDNSLQYNNNGEWVAFDFVKSIEQQQTSGTKIATAKNNDGTSTDIYAPTPTNVIANPSGSTSGDLTKIQIGNVKYDIAGGTEVIANPSGSTSGDLTKIQIDNVRYDVAGGTEVIANPSDSATADLEKIKIENRTYGLHKTTITQRISSGAKIADFTVDGTAGSLYSPTIQSAVVYSTSEQTVGTWIDGSLLYQKTFLANNVYITNDDLTSEFRHNVSNLKMGFVTEAYYDFDYGGTRWYTAMGSVNGNGDRWVVGPTSIFVGGETWYARQERYWLITIRYTKN